MSELHNFNSEAAFEQKKRLTVWTRRKPPPQPGGLRNRDEVKIFSKLVEQIKVGWTNFIQSQDLGAMTCQIDFCLGSSAKKGQLDVDYF